MLQLSTLDYQKIIAHGLRGKPLEICGLLVGKKTEEGVQVLEVHEVDSLDQSPKTYSMDGLKFMKIETAAQKSGLQIVGIYHTHPATVAFPSFTDVERAHWEGTNDLIFPGFSYLIVSLADPQNPVPRSFQITGRRLPEDIVEEAVIVSENNV